MLNKIEVVHLVATDLDGCIGKDNKLMWHLPADMRRFKSLTDGGVVVMGRKTFESLDCKPLPNRINIVLTSNPIYQLDHMNKDLFFYTSVDAAIAKAKYEASLLGLKEVWIIGGQSIYEQTLPYVDSVEKTLVYGNFNGDTHYNLPTCISGSRSTMVYTDTKSGLKYQFLTYNVNKEMDDKSYVNDLTPLKEKEVPLLKINIPKGRINLTTGKVLGRKYDSNKPRYSLLPIGTVNQVVQVLEYGASDKYEVDNWQKIPDARRRFYDAAMRHIDAWWNGEINDLDKDGVKGSQLPHLAHAICCLLFLLWFDDQE